MKTKTAVERNTELQERLRCLEEIANLGIWEMDVATYTSRFTRGYGLLSDQGRLP